MADSPSLDDVRAAKANALKVFGNLAEVVGVGITSIGDGYGLKVNLKALPKAPDTLPTQIDGVPVKVEVVGRIQKRQPEAE